MLIIPYTICTPILQITEPAQPKPATKPILQISKPAQPKLATSMFPLAYRGTAPVVALAHAPAPILTTLAQGAVREVLACREEYDALVPVSVRLSAVLGEACSKAAAARRTLRKLMDEKVSLGVN